MSKKCGSPIARPKYYTAETLGETQKKTSVKYQINITENYS
jgi:hypothetical protein